MLSLFFNKKHPVNYFFLWHHVHSWAWMSMLQLLLSEVTRSRKSQAMGRACFHKHNYTQSKEGKWNIYSIYDNGDPKKKKSINIFFCPPCIVGHFKSLRAWKLLCTHTHQQRKRAFEKKMYTLPNCFQILQATLDALYTGDGRHMRQKWHEEEKHLCKGKTFLFFFFLSLLNMFCFKCFQSHQLQVTWGGLGKHSAAQTFRGLAYLQMCALLDHIARTLLVQVELACKPLPPNPLANMLHILYKCPPASISSQKSLLASRAVAGSSQKSCGWTCLWSNATQEAWG